MEIIINEDIRDYKVKDIGPFTLKQAGGIIAAIVPAYLYWLLSGSVDMEDEIQLTIRIAVCAILATPGILFGFYHKYGLSLFQLLKTVIRENVVNPKRRVYESDFSFDNPEIIASKAFTDEEIGILSPQETVQPEVKHSKEELAELKKWKEYK